MFGLTRLRKHCYIHNKEYCNLLFVLFFFLSLSVGSNKYHLTNNPFQGELPEENMNPTTLKATQNKIALQD